MTMLHRREFLTAAAVATAAAAAALAPSEQASAGDPSFMNNVPDPLLSDADLPAFTYALEQSEGKVIGNNFGKEATVEQLPISKGLAGVSMQLEPGAMLAAFPDGLAGQRVAGIAVRRDAIRDALAELGLNPLVINAFRPRRGGESRDAA